MPKSKIFKSLFLAFIFMMTVSGFYFYPKLSIATEYATPRDWAKFGMLYLRDGIWKGQKLLPDGWVTFSGQTAAGSKGRYGPQFWLNQNDIQYPDAPHNMLIADGFQGQFVFVIPSFDAVIVRMGAGGDHFDSNAFLKNILSTLPKSNTK